MTGFANSFVSQGGRWLELFKEAVPRLTSVANIFFVNELSVQNDEFGATILAAAAQLGVTLIRMPARDSVEIEAAISAFAAEPGGGLLLTGATLLASFEAIGRLALYQHLPLMYGGVAGRTEGLLMAHGSDLRDPARRASSYVDRILRGAKPGELPVQYPTKFELVVNLKTAKAIGVTIPESFVARAGQVIEQLGRSAPPSSAGSRHSIKRNLRDPSRDHRSVMRRHGRRRPQAELFIKPEIPVTHLGRQPD